MALIVTGASGVVGSYVERVFPDAILTNRKTLDVTNPSQTRDHLSLATTVLHLAAATDVDACELDPEMAFRVNAIGTRNVAAACKESGATMVYVSTAGVFDGSTSFSEIDIPQPANVYGISKLAGELAARALVDKLFIVRSGWMMGGGANDHKFVGKIRRQLEAGATEIRAVNDKRGSPTYALDFLQAIKTIMETRLYGIYHAANSGSATRFDVAEEVCRLLKSDAEVIPVSSALFPLPAPRSDSEVLTSLRTAQRPWREALADYLKADNGTLA